MDKSSFTGTWVFDPVASELGSSPSEWIQEVSLDGVHIHVRETITRDTGIMVVEVDATIDGNFYPVKGSSLIKEISYAWDEQSIRGIGRKNGTEVLHETVRIQPDDLMALSMILFINEKSVPLGTARFRRKN